MTYTTANIKTIITGKQVVGRWLSSQTMGIPNQRIPLNRFSHDTTQMLKKS